VSNGTITKQSLYGLSIYNGQFVTVGSEGVAIRSQLIPATTPVAINAFYRTSGDNIFLFSGQPDQQFFLNSSTNLSAWTQGTLLEFFDSTGTLLYLTSTGTGTNAPPRQFFRTQRAL
jgi:hypothetical protein